MMRKIAQNGGQNGPSSDENSSSNDDASHDTQDITTSMNFGTSRKGKIIKKT